MADSDDTPKTPPRAPDNSTAPIIPVQRDDSDTALERAVDLDDDHLPRDTAPLDRADLDALRALAESDDIGEPLGGPTDEVELAEMELDEDVSDDTMNDTMASDAVPDLDDG